MKTLHILTAMICLSALMFNTSCEKDPINNSNPGGDPGDPVAPPVANFSIQGGSPVVNEAFQFSNKSTGNITSYNWNFGSGEGTSSSSSPGYKFKSIGDKTISLTVTGPGGSDTYSQTLTVYSMPPDCHNYDMNKIMSSENIATIYNHSIFRSGRPLFINNYNASVNVMLYHSSSWKDGNYAPQLNYTVAPNQPLGTFLLGPDGKYINIGNDWGIRVVFTNGVKSCIKIMNSCCKYKVHGSYTELMVKASDVYEGTYSW